MAGDSAPRTASSPAVEQGRGVAADGDVAPSAASGQARLGSPTARRPRAWRWCLQVNWALLLTHLIAPQVALAVESAAAVSTAAASKLELQLDLREAAGCATIADIGERVRARSERLVFVEGAARHVEVRASGAAAQWRAEVELQASGQPTVHRELSAQSCDALLDAVAFVIVVSLEPGDDASATAAPPAARAANGTTETAAAPPPSASGQDPAARSAVAEPIQRRAVLDLETPGDPGAHDPVDPPDLRTAPGTTTWALSVGASALWTHGAAPSELWGGGAFGRVQLRNPSYRPFLRASVGLFPERTWASPDGVARFGLLSGALEVCPLVFGFGAFEAGAGAVVVAGRLSAAGERAREPERHNRPWAFIGLGLGAGFELAPLHFGASVRTGPTLARDAFQFAPQVFYRVPGWGTQADIGLSLMLP